MFRNQLSRTVCVCACALGGVAGAAFAQDILADPMGLDGTAALSPADKRAGPYSEDFELFDIGSLNGQGGWYGQFDALVTGDGINGRSLHHAPLSSPVGTYLAMRSPAFDATYERLDFDLVIEPATTTYYVEVVNVDTGLVNTRLQFALDGSISAFQILSQGVGYKPTTGSWTPGERLSLSIQSLPEGDLMIFQDGERVFWGKDVVASITNSTSGIQQFSIIADAVGGTGEILVDNINIIPTPASAFAIVGAMMMMGRRRR